MMKPTVLKIGYPGYFPGICPVNCDQCGMSKPDNLVRFQEVRMAEGEIVPGLNAEGSHIFFVLDGSLKIHMQNGDQKLLQAGECYFYEKTGAKNLRAISPVYAIRLNFVRRMVLCGHDCLSSMATETDFQSMGGGIPILKIEPLVGHHLAAILQSTQLLENPCYHALMLIELFMKMRASYTLPQLISFFRSIIRPKDDFKAFVLSNYTRARSVDDFSRMAHMSKSAFTIKFTGIFHCSVSSWMVKRKAGEIEYAIRYGMTDIKDIMATFCFPNQSVLTRFFKANLGGTPKQVMSRLAQEGVNLSGKNRE